VKNEDDGQRLSLASVWRNVQEIGPNALSVGEAEFVIPWPE
jgi:hypothetical protein